MSNINIAGVRRQAKNVAYNYSETQRKVREATSNDPWGPSSSLMSELADLTHNTVAFTEIMQILWKRLNDHGKNWRHVYKSLVVLDFLIKCGSDKVAQQCRENIFSIETLKDFQHVEENKDQGHNIRQKAQALSALLKDEEKLKNERTKAHMARKRFAQNNMSVGSDGHGGVARRQLPRQSSEFEEARPTSIGEEELQLQIALAMSKEEADRENEARRGDDVRLQMALDESKQDGSEPNSPNNATLGGAAARDEKPSAVDDLLSLSLGQPPAAAHNNSSGAGYPQLGGASMNSDPWAPAPPAYSSTMGANSSTGASSAAANDPWGGAGGMVLSSSTMPRQDLNGMGNGIDSAGDPWAPAAQPVQNASAHGGSQLTAAVALNDPWAPTSENSAGFASEQTSSGLGDGATSADPWASLSSGTVAGGSQQPRTADELMNKRAANKTPESFLGENSNLVNLDDLLGATKVPAAQPAKSVGGGGGSGAAGSHNPFLSSAAPNNPAPTSSGSSSVPPASNPFVLAQRPSPTLNQMRYENNSQPGQAAGGDWALAQPMAPTRATNPFV